MKELEPKLLELSKSPYGHFVVSKLVSLAPKEQLPGTDCMRAVAIGSAFAPALLLHQLCLQQAHAKAHMHIALRCLSRAAQLMRLCWD